MTPVHDCCPKSTMLSDGPRFMSHHRHNHIYIYERLRFVEIDCTPSTFGRFLPPCSISRDYSMSCRRSGCRGRGRGRTRTRTLFSSGRVEYWKKSMEYPFVPSEKCVEALDLSSKPSPITPPGFESYWLYRPTGRAYLKCNKSVSWHRPNRGPIQPWNRHVPHLAEQRRVRLGNSALLQLPAEIRNRIFSSCVSTARFCQYCAKTHDFTVDIAKDMLTSGMSPLPLLFVSKQIHQELLGIIYSQLSPIIIAGYY
jgi:hypothetical protein